MRQSEKLYKVVDEHKKALRELAVTMHLIIREATDNEQIGIDFMNEVSCMGEKFDDVLTFITMYKKKIDGYLG